MYVFVTYMLSMSSSIKAAESGIFVFNNCGPAGPSVTLFMYSKVPFIYIMRDIETTSYPIQSMQGVPQANSIPC